jgi:putative phosphoesterase
MLPGAVLRRVGRSPSRAASFCKNAPFPGKSSCWRLFALENAALPCAGGFCLANGHHCGEHISWEGVAAVLPERSRGKQNMNLAVFSDSHCRQERVRQALVLAQQHSAACFIHCGDITDCATACLFPAGTHFVWGNCDRERDELRRAILRKGGVIHEPFGTLVVAGKSLAFLHGDDEAQMQHLVQCQQYDYLFHGHSHVAGERRQGRTRLLNPGAFCRTPCPTFLLLDLITGQARWLPLE